MYFSIRNSYNKLLGQLQQLDSTYLFPLWLLIPSDTFCRDENIWLSKVCLSPQYTPLNEYLPDCVVCKLVLQLFQSNVCIVEPDAWDPPVLCLWGQLVSICQVNLELVLLVYKMLTRITNYEEKNINHP